MKNSTLEPILPYDWAELEKRVQARMTQKRFAHCQRTSAMAVKLAEQNGGDVLRAKIGGLVHDYAKQIPDADFIQAIHDHHLPNDLLHYGNAIWHGIVGVYFIEDELGLHDPAILQAVQEHTTGSPEMPLLAQIIYMADFIEPGRSFPGVEKARAITAKNLQAGVLFQLSHELTYLVEKQEPIYPLTFTSYNAWVKRISQTTQAKKAE
ncbi:MAG: bis(5'-nucleosyl)-tetraphosphatase (symmetrical) YqeK [Schleiferilactobacillus harbinensis]|jgi:predicted HD superfamily hydrolase involved in NAD metabolism|nr:bis(5'-nucleosyl)-tetraphosphatase (symmetrical) YqeK [Schleiferilactobacillus harbinensis]MCI1913578.1 bis(5'-nucleosyl)-tetraphosphatase (symmetrical) YqeK [Schleiferilactobacillus harbinensis]